MPRGDSTGPWAAGPMTGRGAGYCGGGNAPGYESAPGGGRGGASRGGGRGAGGGFGRGGRGNRNQFYATGLTGWERGVRGPGPQLATSPAAPELTREEELVVLRTQAESIEQALVDIRRRLADLEGE